MAYVSTDQSASTIDLGMRTGESVLFTRISYELVQRREGACDKIP